MIDSGEVSVGAEVMLGANLRAEACLVNGACGKVMSIVEPRSLHMRRDG
jgi:hypothetical protein